MALPAAPFPMPAARPGMPVPGAGGQPGQPPFGSSPATTMPTPNMGLKASALAAVRLAVRIMEAQLPKLGIASDEGKDLMKALSVLAKHIPPDAASPGIEQSAITQQQLQARQEAPMLQMLRQAQSGGAAGPGAQPGSAGPAGQSAPAAMAA